MFIAVTSFELLPCTRVANCALIKGDLTSFGLKLKELEQWIRSNECQPLLFASCAIPSSTSVDISSVGIKLVSIKLVMNDISTRNILDISKGAQAPALLQK